MGGDLVDFILGLFNVDTVRLRTGTAADLSAC